MKTYGLYEIWLLGFLLLAVRQFVQERKFRKYLLEERSCVSVQSTIEKAADGHVMEYRWKEARFCFVRVE